MYLAIKDVKKRGRRRRPGPGWRGPPPAGASSPGSGGGPRDRRPACLWPGRKEPVMSNRGQRLPMTRLARSSAWNGALAGIAPARAGAAGERRQAGPLQLSHGWPRLPGCMLTCGDSKSRPLPRCCGPLGGPGPAGACLLDHGKNSIEPAAWLPRITGAGPFCPGGCSGDLLYPVPNRGFMAHNGPRGQHERDGCAGSRRRGSVRRCDGSRAEIR